MLSEGKLSMPDTSLALRVSVEKAHRCKATCVDKVTVHEKQGGHRVWYGTVHVFDSCGHDSAQRAYAWSISDEARESPRGVTVLHKGQVTNAAEAVRATMARLYPTGAQRDQHIKPLPTK